MTDLEGYSEDTETRNQFARRGALITFPFLVVFFVSFIGAFEGWYDKRVCFTIAGVCALVLVGSLVAVNTLILPRSCLSGQRMRRVIRSAGNGVTEAVYICDVSKTYFCREIVRVTYGRGGDS